MKSLFGLIVIFLLSLTSCDNERFNLDNDDAENVENEAATDGYFEDADDMATLAVAVDPSAAGGRVAGSGRVNNSKPVDVRFSDCVTVTFELAGDHTQQNPHGYITIEFGAGCTDSKGNVRSGIIHVEFVGRRFLPGAKIITTFENYFINGVKLEGTHTVTNITGSTELSPKFSIVLTGGKATWPDGSTATRTVNRTREWIRGTNPLNDEWIVDGTAEGTNRNEVAYKVVITTPLVYKRECAISKKVFMPVEGVKVLTTVNNEVTIDYGNGECDKTVTVTINGRSKTVEVRGNI